MTLFLVLSLAAPAYAAPGAKGAGADSTISIVVYDKQPTLTIHVVDQGNGACLCGVRVELRDPDHPEMSPITGSPLGLHETNDEGKIEIKLFPDEDQKYQIWVDYLGYEPYVGDIFTVTEPGDTYKRVELTRRSTSGGGGDAGGGGDRDDRWVYYHAGVGGSLDGAERERVAYNGSPRKVPTPVPEEGYDFAGWMLDGKYVEPASLKVRATIHLDAVFERKPVPSPTQPPASPAPSPTGPPASPPPSGPPAETIPPTRPSQPAPAPSRRPAAPGSLVQGGGPDGPDGTYGGTDGPYGPETGAPEPETPGPAVPHVAPGVVEPPPEAGREQETGRRVPPWWILLCAALTAALGLLRLRVIRRRVRSLERQAREDKKELTLK